MNPSEYLESQEFVSWGSCLLNNLVTAATYLTLLRENFRCIWMFVFENTFWSCLSFGTDLFAFIVQHQQTEVSSQTHLISCLWALIFMSYSTSLYILSIVCMYLLLYVLTSRRVEKELVVALLPMVLDPIRAPHLSSFIEVTWDDLNRK